MKLRDYEAEFVCDGDGEESGKCIIYQRNALGRTPQGILMDSPCSCEHGHALLVWFDRGLNGGPPAGPAAVPLVRWKVSGTSLDDLTLEPSINAGCWHGWIRNGEVTNA